jgi:hypothetical protein
MVDQCGKSLRLIGPNGQKRPIDAIDLAVMISKIETGEIEDERDAAHDTK